MTTAGIVSLEIRGFRAFGTGAAHFELDAPLVVAHAGNSQGKTSLAEAVEFLLSGRSSRRELLGGAKAEYNDSLRNAHLSSGDDSVYVEAVIRTDSGRLHRVRRDLTCDFGRGSECESQLLLDGQEIEDLSSVGFGLADPPVRAPVLLQHILRHALSTEPKQRVAYFKSLLSLSDLDLFRERVADARKSLEGEPEGPWLQRINALPPDLSPFRDRVRVIGADSSTAADKLRDTLSAALLEAASAATDEAYASLADARSGLEQRANTKAEALFPVAPFVTAPMPEVDPRAPDMSAYENALTAIETEAARLLPIFAAVLQVDEFAELTVPQDCPVCATPTALTARRIETLKTELANAAGLDRAAGLALASAGTASEELSTIGEFVRTGLPTAGEMPEAQVAELAAKLADWGVDADLLHWNEGVEPGPLRRRPC